MSGETVTSMADAVGSSGKIRKRSKIAFPYIPLKIVLELAKAIHAQVGTSSCSNDQLAAWIKQSPKSSGFRSRLVAARLFGVIRSPQPSQYQLTTLGLQAMDPDQSREARSDAFLRVPLYKAVFDKYRGGAVPPPAALEREMESLGIASQKTGHARVVLERSAQEAGFYEGGENRLVKPGVSQDDHSPTETDQAPPHDDSRSGGTGGGNGSDLHPFIQGLLSTLPNTKTEWKVDQRIKWLKAAALIFDLMYEGDGGIQIQAVQNKPSPAQRESPDVQAIRMLSEAAFHFGKSGNYSAASKISYLAEEIVMEGSLDLDGYEGLMNDIEKENARATAEIASRLETKR